jgi:hypothetical protein
VAKPYQGFSTAPVWFWVPVNLERTGCEAQLVPRLNEQSNDRCKNAMPPRMNFLGGIASLFYQDHRGLKLLSSQRGPNCAVAWNCCRNLAWLSGDNWPYCTALWIT